MEFSQVEICVRLGREVIDEETKAIPFGDQAELKLFAFSRMENLSVLAEFRAHNVMINRPVGGSL